MGQNTAEERPDVSGMGPEEAAKTVYEYLREHQAYHEDDVVIFSPEETAKRRDGEDCWMVVWKTASSSEWAIKLTGGISMHGSWAGESQPEIKGMYEGEFIAEPYYSFDLLFYPKK